MAARPPPHRAGAVTGAVEGPPPSPAADSSRGPVVALGYLTITDLMGDPGPAHRSRDGPVRPHARGETVTTHFEDIIRQNSQRLDDLKKTTEELQRELSEARVSLERELARSPRGHAALTEQIPVYPGPGREAFSAHAPVPAQGHYAEDPLPYYAEDSGPYYVAAGTPFAGEGPRYDSTAGIGGPRVAADDFRSRGSTALDRPAWDRGAVGDPAFDRAASDPGAADHAVSDCAAAPRTASDYAAADHEASDYATSDPTVGIVSHGRRSAYRRRLSRRSIIAITAAAVVLVTVLAVIITSGGASWPASVAAVQRRSPGPARIPMWYPSLAR